jgi:hypothetical protein
VCSPQWRVLSLLGEDALLRDPVLADPGRKLGRSSRALPAAAAGDAGRGPGERRFRGAGKPPCEEWGLRSCWQ